MPRKRVVITGLSAITPLGHNLEETWDGVLAGKSGAGYIEQFDTTGFDTRVACEVKNFQPDARIPVKQVRHMDRFVQFAVSATMQLLDHSGYVIDESNAEETGVVHGVGLGGLSTLETFHSRMLDAGPSRVSPFYIPMLIANMAPGHSAVLTGAKGINVVTTSACASSLHAIGYAYSEILLDRAQAIFSGGMEATITPLGICGFTSMKALCMAFEDEPTKASRPFDKDRAGFVMGEGAAMVLVESLDSALARNATIYAEIAGFGSSDDAYHIVAPLESGDGMAMSMSRALRDAGLQPEQINHISAHGTSTQAGDVAETRAIHKVFGSHALNIPVVALKSQLGHMLGAAGGAATVVACKSIETGLIPRTINLDNQDPECDLNYMADGPKKLNPEHVLVNAFGFGGTNASLVLKKYKP